MSTGERLGVALLRAIFDKPRHEGRLIEQLKSARQQGADLVVLPELPYNPWSPATRNARLEDAEAEGGWRETMQNAAAKSAGVAVLGGVIRLDDRRYNTAVLSDAKGKTIASYAKIHLPDEEGFREVCHYDAGHTPPRVISALGGRIGVQICSDANRPVGSQLLAAQGVQVILAPRATSVATWDRWRLAYQAMALTCAAWVVSVGRPGPERSVPLGGPSLVVNPHGEVVLETEETLAIISLDLCAADAARQEYPGYLQWPADLYAKGWAAASQLR